MRQCVIKSINIQGKKKKMLNIANQSMFEPKINTIYFVRKEKHKFFRKAKKIKIKRIKRQM